MSVRQFLLGAMLALCAAWSTLGSAASVIVDVAPPEPRAIVAPPPRAGYVWAPGYWRWSPHHREYVWVDGRWLHERRGYHWVPEAWVVEGQRWRFVPGHWER